MEISHLLEIDETGAMLVHDKDSAFAKVRFWLDTPKGTCWGNAAWGNRLEQFKHEPQGSALDVAMENIIFTDINIDLPNVRVKGLRIEVVDKELFIIWLNTNYGLIKHTSNRSVTGNTNDVT